MDVTGWKRENLVNRKKWLDRFYAARTVIVGGGGLLEFEKYFDTIDFIQANKKNAVIWGAGHNSVRISSWSSLKPKFNHDYSGYKLIGVRDYNQPYEWVPCASCLAPIFDQKFEITKEFAFFANTGSNNYEAFYPKGIPRETIMSNTKSTFEEIISHLASAETVVTSSFHGAYWGQLLGRKVVALPTSSKFYDMKHPVPICHPADWRRFALLARTYPEALDECRAANMAFGEKVLNL